jgi:hypothetical protein
MMDSEVSQISNQILKAIEGLLIKVRLVTALLSLSFRNHLNQTLNVRFLF